MIRRGNLAYGCEIDEMIGTDCLAETLSSVGYFESHETKMDLSGFHFHVPPLSPPPPPINSLAPILHVPRARSRESDDEGQQQEDDGSDNGPVVEWAVFGMLWGFLCVNVVLYCYRSQT